MKHTLALVLMVFGLAGCASTIDTSSPEAQEKMRQIRAERLASEANNNLIDKRNLASISNVEKREMLTSIREQRLIAEKLNGRSLESMTASEKDSLLKEVRKLIPGEETPAEKRLRIALEESRERKKQELILELNKRCEDYGFTGESNISACIQREAQHDRELAMQRLELEKTRLALQQAQSRTYVQNVTEPVQKEEDLPFLIKFLGDVAMGVAEAYADPNRIMIENQQQQINSLKRQSNIQQANCVMNRNC
ncbi:hypothetical protein N9K19_01240 [Gammaproteobacteria bacterium]|nr:hypothetical protein [Gammaproteobacteria bacterium]